MSDLLCALVALCAYSKLVYAHTAVHYLLSLHYLHYLLSLLCFDCKKPEGGVSYNQLAPLQVGQSSIGIQQLGHTASAITHSTENATPLKSTKSVP